MSIKKNKLLILGSTGLVGSRFLEIYRQKYSFVTLGRANTDITANLLSKKDLEEKIKKLNLDFIINFAAYTDVDGAEAQKGDKNGETYILNCLLPLWLANYCKNSGTKLYHISTDYVFNGTEDSRPYTEEDRPDPVNSWYAMTKYFGEENILKSDSKRRNCAIIRVSYPYSGLYNRKLDMGRAVVEKLKNNELYFGTTDQKVKPVSVDDIAHALSFLLNNHATGIYHTGGNYSPDDYITPYDFAKKIASVLGLNSALITPISFLNLSKKRIAPRPQHTWLSTKKIKSLGFKFINIEGALQRFKQQLTEA